MTIVGLLFPAGFLFYASLVITAVLILIFHYVPQYGQTHIMCYIGICSLIGSLSVCIDNSTVLELFLARAFSDFQLGCLFLTGHECQSTRDSHKVNIVWNESATISPDLGLYFGCPDLRAYSNELLKYGKYHHLISLLFFPLQKTCSITVHVAFACIYTFNANVVYFDKISLGPLS